MNAVLHSNYNAHARESQPSNCSHYKVGLVAGCLCFDDLGDFCIFGDEEDVYGCCFSDGMEDETLGR
ncbi:hypothetical protein RJT34_13951 [Clitoria ternatea]|uniref:Uncharacterized protein n=1 Tax=Clitoria ternatea TaxID=43366 RepID=A0AAN9JSF9_CLITE